MTTMFTEIKKLYVFGEWEEGSFRYTGVQYRFDEKGLAYGLPAYVEKMTTVPEDDFRKLTTPGSKGSAEEKVLNLQGSPMLVDRMLEYQPPPHLTAEMGEAVDEVIKYTKTHS